MFWLLTLLFITAFGIYCGIYEEEKEYRRSGWTIFGIFFSTFFILFFIQIGVAYDEEIKLSAKHNQTLAFCNSIEDIKNVMNSSQDAPNAIISGSLENINQRAKATEAAIKCADLKADTDFKISLTQTREKSWTAFFFTSAWALNDSVQDLELFGYMEDAK